MGREKTYIFTCDICRVKTTEPGTPEGWTLFSTEDRMEERKFNEHALCGECLNDILDASQATSSGN